MCQVQGRKAREMEEMTLTHKQSSTQSHTHTYTSNCAHNHTHIQFWPNLKLNNPCMIHIYTYVHTHNIRIHTYIHTYVHTHTYIYTHTCIYTATLSTVPFPVDAYLRRIDGVAQHVRASLGAKGLLPQERQPAPDPEHVLQVMESKHPDDPLTSDTTFTLFK